MGSFDWESELVLPYSCGLESDRPCKAKVMVDVLVLARCRNLNDIFFLLTEPSCDRDISMNNTSIHHGLDAYHWYRVVRLFFAPRSVIGLSRMV